MSQPKKSDIKNAIESTEPLKQLSKKEKEVQRLFKEKKAKKKKRVMTHDAHNLSPKNFNQKHFSK